MRTIIVFAIIISSLKTQAQAPALNVAPPGFFGHSVLLPDSASDKKWFFSTYSGLSTGFYFLKGIGASYFTVPIGLQLNRELNKNLYAFAGVSVAPAYTNFNQSFLSTDVNKMYPSSIYNNNFGLYSRAELGLMYVNDARTFSISGSIGVQKGSYPFAPYGYSRKNPVVIANK